MNYRNQKLTQTARGAPCAGNFDGCNNNPETSVWAHSNYAVHGKGGGIKAHDCFGAILCSNCHAWLDHGSASYEEKYTAFVEAMHRTLLYLWTSGKIAVAGSSAPREKSYKPLSKIVPRKT